jgi:acetyltransferase
MITNEQLESTHVDKPDGDQSGRCPSPYVSEFQASDGTHFTVRPIRPDDEPLLADFHRHLSEETVYRRYFTPLRLDVRIAHKRLLQHCLIDYHNEIAFIATYLDESGKPHLAAVARLIKLSDSSSAEVAFVVADQHQHHGLGTYLLDRIIDIARKEGIGALEAVVLADNFSMKDLFRRAGFKLQTPQAGDVTVRLGL